MSEIRSYTETITTAADQTATVYFGSAITGKVLAIKYEPGSSQLATTADLTIIGETTGVPILTKVDAGVSTVWYYPRVAITEVSDGSAATDFFTCVNVFKERIKLSVAQGGESKTGSMTIFVEEGPSYQAS